MRVTKAQIGKMFVAVATMIGQFAWMVDEPIYRVSLLLLFTVVWVVGFSYE